MADPLSTFTNEQLYNGMLALQLACGRSHGGQRKKREQWYCFLFQALLEEANARGAPHPSPPFNAGSLPPFSL